MKQIYNKLLFILCVCLCHSVWLHAGDVVSTPLPFMDKLSANELRLFYQDREGFVWMGTSMGVARYDGYEIQEFRNNYLRPSLLVDNNIVCFTDNDRFVWIGTEKGITLVDKQNMCFSPFPDQRVQRDIIRDLYTDRNNKVWVASRDGHLYRCDNEGKKVEKEYALASRPNIFSEDRAGNMWIGTMNGGIYLYDKKKDSFVRYPFPHNVYRMIQARSGHFWIATWDAGIWRFDPQRPAADRFVSQPIVNTSRGLRESTFYDLVQDDADGYLWALSHFKLYVLKENADGMLEEIPVSLLTGGYGMIDQGKSYNRIMKDREGNLWLAAYDKSSLILFKKDYVENFLLPDIHEMLGFDANLVGLSQDRSGVIWMTQGRYGLCLYNAQTGKAELGYNPRSLYSLNVPFLIPSEDGGMWAADEKAILYKLRQNGFHVQIEKTWNLSKLVSDEGKTTAMELDAKGNLWLSTDKHLFVYAKEDGRLCLFAKDLRGIKDLERGRDGKPMALSGDKVYELNYNHGKASCSVYFSAGQTLAKGDAFKTFTFDGLGDCWIVTEYGRVLRVTAGKEHTLTDFSKEFNAEGENIVRVLADKKNLWVIFQKKILQYGLAKGNYIFYTVWDNNIALTSFRRGAGFIDSAGNLYVGGHLGFIKILPNNTPMVEPKRKVYISDVSVGDSSLFSRTDGKGENTFTKVYLRPSDTNVSILFSALQYDDNRKISYAYQLEGMDKDWVVVKDGKHRAFYNRLSKGNYTFKVRMINPSGEWDKDCTTLTIVRLPAWYEAWYAYLCYLIVTVSAVYFGRKLYFAYKEQRRKEAERRKALENEINRMQQREEDYQKNLDNSLAMPIVKLDYESTDKMFLEEAVKCVEANLKNQDFDLGQLADALNVSRSTLNRRVKSMCGITPLDMIRNIRLKHACEMLSAEEDVAVSDVAYATGFSNPRYFSKCFKDKFGVIPTEYQTLIKEKERK